MSGSDRFQNTIELHNFSPDSSSEIKKSVESSINVVKSKKKSEIQLLQEQHLIEKQFAKLNSISNLKMIMFFIYKCFAFDLVITLYHAYLLIDACTDVTSLDYTPIHLIGYGISIINALLYLQIIIINGDYNKELEQIKLDSEFKPKIKLKITIASLDLPVEDITMVLNRPTAAIRNVYIFRFLTWHMKYIIYIVLMGVQSNVNAMEYLSILTLFIDYYLYHLLKFYYFLILRIEAYKIQYGLEDPQ